jgi:hypothetical protein
MYVYACVYVYVFVCNNGLSVVGVTDYAHVCIYVYNVNICMYLCMYMYMYMYMYMHICMHMYL